MSGHDESKDGSVSMDWSMPEYSALDRRFCRIGLHIVSRKRLLRGAISYFTRVDYYYCACGARRWIWYAHGFASAESTSPGEHAAWIAQHESTNE